MFQFSKSVFSFWIILFVAAIHNELPVGSAYTIVTKPADVDLVDMYKDSLKVSQTCQDEWACRARSVDSSTCLTTDTCFATTVCTGRESLPNSENPLNDWETASNHDGCRVVAGVPTPGPPTTFNVGANEFSLDVNGSADGLTSCFSKRNTSTGNVFTVSFWLMATCTNCSVLELPLSVGQPSIHVRVEGRKLCINGDQCFALSLNDWTRVTLRVIKDEMTLFLDRIAHPISHNGVNLADIQNIYVGSSEIASIGDIYSLYDVRYYNDALTSREINDSLITGLPDLSVNEPRCVCPSQFPELSSTDTDLCTNGTNTIPRFNTTILLHSPKVITDRDDSTNWASADSGPVSIGIDFKAVFLINTFSIQFADSSEMPGRAFFTFTLDGIISGERNLPCQQKSCTFSFPPIDPTSMTKVIHNVRRAQSVTITLVHADDSVSKSFILKDLVVNGSCDCNGNAEECKFSGDNYTCECLPDTHTSGPTCADCNASFYRQQVDFGCPYPCECNVAGSNGTSCQEIGGQCDCKLNVEGQKCDKCKHWTHSLSAANSKGCLPCSCDENGSLACNPDNGDCSCKSERQPPTCSSCRSGFFNVSNCQPCGCNTTGTTGQTTTCSESDGQCDCKDNVQGRTCESCKPGFYQLDPANPMGCTSCGCHQVGTENDSCNTNTGQCHCRGNVFTDKKCSPEVSLVDPLYGPENGGTKVTIYGQLLGNSTNGPEVFFGATKQNVIETSDRRIVFETRHSNNLGSSNIKLGWGPVDLPLDLGVNNTFVYKPIPVINMDAAQGTMTYISGGCIVHVNGINLASVKYPLLEIRNQTGQAVTAVCRHVQNAVICPTPNIELIFGNTNSQYQMKAILDGQQSALMDITVFHDPSFESNRNIEFEYPFEKSITIHGARAKSACQENTYSVLIGLIHCDIIDLTDTYIKCEPPETRPGGHKTHKVTVKIGNFQHVVGTLEYMEFYETTGFIIIICCIAGVILIVLGVLIFCCCTKRCRNKSGGNPFAFKKHTNNSQPQGQNRQMNVYSDLSVANANPTNNGNTTANGHNVYAESIIREPKKGIVNTSAEETVLIEEFLPHVEPSLRDDIRVHHIGRGHFNMSRQPILKGARATLIEGTLQKNGAPVSKLTIKSLTDPLPGTSGDFGDSQFPTWANQALAECLRLKLHNHNHVLSIQGIGIEPQRFHILYPQMAQGTLKAVVSNTSKEFSVRHLLGFSQQVLEGLTFLACKEITHKDVAARNCMVNEHSVVKLGDAALSWDFYPEEYVYDDQRERYIPLRWMAPESITDGFYDTSTDVWSFGVLVWELLTRGCLPFHEVTVPSAVKEYILEGYVLGKPDTMADDLYAVLTNCWSVESEARPTLSSISRSLIHILEGDEDVYANTIGSTFPHSPRRMQVNNASNIYETPNLSVV